MTVEVNLSVPSKHLFRFDYEFATHTINTVSDHTTVDALNLRYSGKYDTRAVFGENLPVWWYYEIAQRD